MKVSEVAEAFEVTDATVREWLRDGIIKGVKIGKGHYWRVPEEEVRRLAESRYGQ